MHYDIYSTVLLDKNIYNNRVVFVMLSNISRRQIMAYHLYVIIRRWQTIFKNN